MAIAMSFHPGQLGSRGRSIYRQRSCTLVYEGKRPMPAEEARTLADTIDRTVGIRPPSDFPTLLVADTLTIVFDGANQALVSLDAYTNRDLWVPSQNSDVPEINGRGMLLIEAFPEDNERYALGITPRYEIAANEGWVRIGLANDMAEAHYEVAQGLIVGLAHGQVSDIFLLAVAFL